MKKRFIVILGCILILIMSGLNNTRKDKYNDNEPYKEVSTLKNMLDETINNKYIFKEFKDRVYKNKKYLYDVNDSLICYFDGDKTSIFLSTKGEYKNLKLIKEKYDYFGMGLSYVFKDESNERYRLYITKIDDENLYFKWVYPDKSYEEFTTELFNKNECENRIKTRMNEVEIDNLLESDFKDSSGLDIDKIKEIITNYGADIVAIEIDRTCDEKSRIVFKLSIDDELDVNDILLEVVCIEEVMKANIIKNIV